MNIKEILPLVCVLFYSQLANAQESALGKNEGYLIDSLSKLHYIPSYKNKVSKNSFEEVFAYFDNRINHVEKSNSKESNNSTTILIDTSHYGITYLIENDTCKMSIITLRLSHLDSMIRYLDLKYKKVNKDQWINYQGTNEIVLLRFEDTFAVEFKKIK